MDPTNFFGKNIVSVLEKLREEEDILEYSKIEGDEFIKLPEKGFYLHSKEGSGKIFDCRIYFYPYDGYFPSSNSVRGKFSEAVKLSHIEAILGEFVREIRSVKIPTRSPTLGGKEFRDNENIVTVFSEDGENITFLHVRAKSV